jgi:hypothetical protein
VKVQTRAGSPVAGASDDDDAPDARIAGMADTVGASGDRVQGVHAKIDRPRADHAATGAKIDATIARVVATPAGVVATAAKAGATGVRIGTPAA